MDKTNPEEKKEKVKRHFPTWKFCRPFVYKPELCDLVVELGRQGKSLFQMAVACNVAKVETLRQWQKKFPEFKDALDYAHLCSQDWWEEKGRLHVVDRDGEKLNATYPKQMQIRFKDSWRQDDKLEIDAMVTTVPTLSFAERPEDELSD